MSESGNNTAEVRTGLVTEALPNTEFRIFFESTQEGTEGEEIIAYLAGKMKIHRIRVLPGDHVEVLINPHGGKGRITKRLRQQS